MIGNIKYKYLDKLISEIDKCFDTTKRIHLIQMLVNDIQYRLYAINESERTEFRLMSVDDLIIQDDKVITKETIIYRGDDYLELIELLNKLNKEAIKELE